MKKHYKNSLETAKEFPDHSIVESNYNRKTSIKTCKQRKDKPPAFHHISHKAAQNHKSCDPGHCCNSLDPFVAEELRSSWQQTGCCDNLCRRK